ncbi:MAG TPA: glutaminyl-peptide cyclotransferase, partial [Herpetosiphonaceae bacterium]
APIPAPSATAAPVTATVAPPADAYPPRTVEPLTGTVAPTQTPRAYPQPTVAQSPVPTAGAPLQLGYRVIKSYPHDPRAYTQGLEIEDGVLYEGTGLEGESTLRRVNLETGEVLQSVALPSPIFGEGVTVLDGKIYQLTWQSNVGYVYDAKSFEKLSEWSYDSEGWGLTDDGSQLIMSDGTPTIRFLDPASLAIVREIQVSDQGNPVLNLNELEYIDGAIYANIWQTDRIVAIDPATGAVRASIDMTGLLPVEARAQTVDVLNGIAYDHDQKRLFVTGKLWPTLFEVEFVPR